MHHHTTLQALFESFAVPGIYLSSPPVFELYASGKENGVVVGCMLHYYTYTLLYVCTTIQLYYWTATRWRPDDDLTATYPPPPTGAAAGPPTRCCCTRAYPTRGR